jgi:hypothetical protein
MIFPYDDNENMDCWILFKTYLKAIGLSFVFFVLYCLFLSGLKELYGNLTN